MEEWVVADVPSSCIIWSRSNAVSHHKHSTRKIESSHFVFVVLGDCHDGSGADYQSQAQRTDESAGSEGLRWNAEMLPLVVVEGVGYLLLHAVRQGMGINNDVVIRNMPLH